ncbi:right-handed parallel beta-helix repeat-containing protein [Methanobrevibacter millerae]|uniref:Right handed beta helix region n=1 Tax=Methanobrevibacter millerae TaxID=230361 RepID=A0A1G5X7M0_9EURY|nr:right-handed parallel beta-helix repeat-containing protein [Methanobrevibacter millerae]SDA65757.1 Right handed beta helix region [Methanobrevibacter millerae]
MNVKNVNKVLNILIICMFALVMISSVNASDDVVLTDFSNGTAYTIISDLSNADIQMMIDGASKGDTFEFSSKSYDNISLIIDKPLKIVSYDNSTVNVLDTLTDKSKAFGLENTFGFYFTQKSSGSILSGFNIIADNADYAVILDASSNTIIENNTFSKALNNVLVRNASNVLITNNCMYNATKNSLQVRDVHNIRILNNTIGYNGRSGIETSNIYDSEISWNEVFFNGFNGISMYNRSANNNVTYNHVYENTNGIFIDSQSSGDRFYYNTLEFNRMDPNCELGGFETGNGVLFGEDYETVAKSKPDISYNALIHNENFQAKNNPSKDQFKLGPNYFDSNDGEHTFICPMLLAKILKMDFTSVSNGIGIKIYEDGQPVDDFAFFDQKISVDGKEYSVKIQNGQGVVELDSSQDHTVEIQHGEKMPDYRKETVEKYTPSSKDNEGSSSGGSSSDNEGSGSGEGESSGSGSGSGSSDSTTSSNDGKGGKSSNSGNANSNVNSNSTSTVSNNRGNVIANYGTNSSDVISESTSQTGEMEQSQGQENAAEAGSVDSGESSSPGDSETSGKAYDISSVSKKSNPLQDNSIVIVAAIILLVALFIYGYRRKNEFE